MLVIRLQRTGRENTPTYRIVVSEKTRSAKKGAHEILGHYLPSQKTPVFTCDTERATFWISKGAIPSDTVARLLKKNGLDGMEKYIIRYSKQKKRGEQPEAPPAPAAAPAPEAPAAPKAEEKPAQAEATPVATPAAEEKPAEEEKAPAEAPASKEEAAKTSEEPAKTEEVKAA